MFILRFGLHYTCVCARASAESLAGINSELCSLCQSKLGAFLPAMHTHTQFINNKMTFHYVLLLCIYSKWEDVVCILVGGGGFGRIVRQCLVNLVTPYVPIS